MFGLKRMVMFFFARNGRLWVINTTFNNISILSKAIDLSQVTDKLDHTKKEHLHPEKTMWPVTSNYIVQEYFWIFYYFYICFNLFCRSVLPVWEELLLFNENFNYFTKADPKVIVLFEVSYSNIALRL